MNERFLSFEKNVFFCITFSISCMMHFLLFCSVNSWLLPASLVHPTALSICLTGRFPLTFAPLCINPHPSYLLDTISSSYAAWILIWCSLSVFAVFFVCFIHTSGNPLCWWAPFPTQDVWACSFPRRLLLRCSLVPSLNEVPSPHQRGHAVHGPQSPFSQSRETTGSTAFLRITGLTFKMCQFHSEARIHCDCHEINPKKIYLWNLHSLPGQMTPQQSSLTPWWTL